MSGARPSRVWSWASTASSAPSARRPSGTNVPVFKRSRIGRTRDLGRDGPVTRFRHRSGDSQKPLIASSWTDQRSRLRRDGRLMPPCALPSSGSGRHEHRGHRHLRGDRGGRYGRQASGGAGHARQIAEAALEAAAAGAAIAHIHVRDPKTGKGARDPALYPRGGRAHPGERQRRRDQPHRRHGRRLRGRARRGADPGRGPATDFVGPLERLVHIAELRPEICSLDCGSLNFGDDNLVVVNTPRHLRAGARRIRELGRQAGARDLRYRQPLVREADAGRGPDRASRPCSSSAWGSPGACRRTPR